MSSHGQSGDDPHDYLNRLPSHAQLDSTGIPRDRLGIPYRGVNNAGKGDIDSLLISNAMLLRQEILRKFLDPRRDIDDECGYPKGSLSPQFYQDLYDKDPISQRVVQVYPRESWQVSPKVYEDPDGEATTPFELAFDAIGKKLLGERSYFLPSTGGGSLIWEYLRRADELSGIGSFGIILIGMDDGKRLDEPAFKPDEPDGVGLYLQGTDKQYFRTASQAADTDVRRRSDDTWSPQGKGDGSNGTAKKESGPTAPGVKDKWSKALGNIGRKLPLGKGKPTGNAFPPKRVGPGEEVDDVEADEPAAGRDEAGAEGDGEGGTRLGVGRPGEGPDTGREDTPGEGENPTSPGPGDDGQSGGGDDQVDESSPEDQEAAKKAARKLTFLRVFPESMVQVTQYESHLTSPRFGKPVMYLVTLNDPKQQNSGIGLPTMTVNVHWTRVIHLAEDLQSSETFGTPRMQPVLPRILDLRKLYGGSAEMYWRGAFPGHSFESVPELGGDVKFDPQAMRNAYEEYSNGLQRAMFLAGFTMKSQAPQVVDPASQINVQLEAICIKLGMPVRILKGSERGELASSQDDAAWNDRLRFRQLGYLTPRVIVPLIDRLITLGILPAPEVGPDGEAKKGKVIVNRSVLIRNAETGKIERVKATPLEMDLDVGYSVEWPDLDSLGDTDRANLGLVNTQALTAYIAGNGQAAVPMHDFLTSKKFLGMEDEEATAMLDKVEEDAKAQEANDQFLAAQGEGQGAMTVGPDGQPLPPQIGPDGNPLPPSPGQTGSPPGAPPRPGVSPNLQHPAGPPTPPPIGTPRPPRGISPRSSQPPPAAPPVKSRPPFARNTFCPTGDGGGIDPSCSPKDSKGGGSQPEIRGDEAAAAASLKALQLSQATRPARAKEVGRLGGNPMRFAEQASVMSDATMEADGRFAESFGLSRSEGRADDQMTAHFYASSAHTDAARSHASHSKRIRRETAPDGDVEAKKRLNRDRAAHDKARKAHLEAAELHRAAGHRIKTALTDNTFCPTGQGGGVDATCGKDGGGKGGGSSSEGAGTKGRLAAMFPKTAAAVESIRGTARAVGQGVWSKLPGPVKVSLSAVYSAAKFVEHGLEGAYHAGQKAAVAIAKERGYTDEQATKLGKVLGTLDGVARWTTNIPVAHHALEALAHVGGWTGFGAAKVGFYVPVASLAYVAQSTLRNPFATIRAARKAVQSAMGKDMKATSVGEITPASPKESSARSIPTVKAPDREKAPKLSVRPLSRNEIVGNAGHWVTLVGGQHVFISDKGTVHPGGPGTPAVGKDSLGEYSKAVESAPKYTTVAGWTYKNGVAVPKEEHQAYKKGELGKPIGDVPKSSEPPSSKANPGDKLDAQEKDAIHSWSMGGYEYMHAHERGEPGSSMAQYAKTLNSALDKMPFHKGELYRGAGLTAAELKDYKVGSTITAKTTDSYSLSRETAVNVFLNPKIEDSARAKGRTPVLIKIDNPKTARSVSGNVISIAEKEGEAITRKGTQYKVKKVIDRGTHKEIHLSEVGTNNSLNQLARAQHLILNAASSSPENQDPYDMVHQMTLNVSKAEQGLIADALEAHDFDDWYIALLYGAMDEAGGKAKEAVAAADAAYELNPTPPRGVDLETPQDEGDDDGEGQDEQEAAAEAAGGEEGRSGGSVSDDEEERTDNAFCPTGKGGGVDPSCSPHSAGRGSSEGAVHAAEAAVAAEPTAPPLVSRGRVYKPSVEADHNGDGVADHARVGVPAMATPPPPPVGQLPNLTPRERRVEQKFIAAFHADPQGMADAFHQAVTAGTKPGEAKTFGTDDAKVLSRDWTDGTLDVRSQNRATLNNALHQVANAIAKRAFVKELDSLKPGDEVMVTVGGCGAGKGYALKNVPEALAMKGRSRAVWDSAGDQNATENPWVQTEAEARGLKVNYVYVHADPYSQWAHPERGVVKRAQDPNDGRMVDAKVFADSYAMGAKNHQAFYEANKDNPSASFVFLSNGKGGPQKLDGIPREALEIDRRELAEYATSHIAISDAPPHVKRGALQGVRIWKRD